MLGEIEEIESLVLRLVGVPAGAIGSTLRVFVGRLRHRRKVVCWYVLDRSGRRGMLLEVRGDDVNFRNVVRDIVMCRRLCIQERGVGVRLQRNK